MATLRNLFSKCQFLTTPCSDFGLEPKWLRRSNDDFDHFHVYVYVHSLSITPRAGASAEGPASSRAREGPEGAACSCPNYCSARRSTRAIAARPCQYAGQAEPCHWPSQGALHCLAATQATTEARAGPRRHVPSLLLIIPPRRATLSRGHSSQDGITSGSTPPCAVSVADHLPKPVGIHCLSAIEARTEARAGRRHRAPSLLLTILQIKACYTVSRLFKPGRKHERFHAAVCRRCC